MSRFRQPHTFYRRPPATKNEDGIFIEDFPGTFVSYGSLQPASGRDMQPQEDGRRFSSVYCFYTSDELYAGAQADPDTGDFQVQNPDILLIGGEQYEVTHKEMWQNNIRNHWRYLLTKREQNILLVDPDAEP